MASQVFMIAAGKVPCDPPKTIPIVLNANSDIQEIDLGEVVRQGYIGSIQGVFIDNLDGPAFTIECDVTRHRVGVGAGSQMVLQLLCTNPAKFAVKFAGAGMSRFHFVNFPVITQVF